MQVLDNMLEEARNMAFALWGPSDLKHAGEESALILCGNSNDRKLWQAQEVTAKTRLEADCSTDCELLTMAGAGGDS